MTNGFYLYRHSWISFPHFDCQLSDSQCADLLKQGGWMVRNTFDFDCNTPTDFWYIIKDSFGGMDELSTDVRNMIRRAFNRYEYKMVDIQLIENEGFGIAKKVNDSFVLKDRRMNSAIFEELLKSWKNGNCDYWGVFDLNQNFVGFAVVRVFDSGCFYDMISICPEYKHDASYPYYGFFYKLNEYYLGEKHIKYVTDGSRSVTEHSNIQPFLMQKFNFRKAYCKLKIKYKWWFGIAVKLLMPFGNIIRNRNVKAVLNMHKMQYAH